MSRDELLEHLDRLVHLSVSVVSHRHLNLDFPAKFRYRVRLLERGFHPLHRVGIQPLAVREHPLLVQSRSLERVSSHALRVLLQLVAHLGGVRALRLGEFDERGDPERLGNDAGRVDPRFERLGVLLRVSQDREVVRAEGHKAAGLLAGALHQVLAAEDAVAKRLRGVLLVLRAHEVLGGERHLHEVIWIELGLGLGRLASFRGVVR